jgi:hypothetical protein
MAESERALDLLSISQTPVLFCPYGAPLVAIIVAGQATITQSCCNHWECPVCGEKRAKQEYRRIVAGCESLAIEHELYFWTITCRGKECSYDEAMQNYLAWTNQLFTNARKKCKTEGGYWAYVQVTEHQQATRSHPHSHIITTFLPSDAVRTTESVDNEIYASAWFARANYAASLGSQHKISHVRSAAGVSRYVAKYMFKSALTEKWPPHWKRVRYSQNWPPLPKFTPDFVVVLRSTSDWQQAAKQRRNFICDTPAGYELARHHIGNILPPG